MEYPIFEEVSDVIMTLFWSFSEFIYYFCIVMIEVVLMYIVILSFVSSIICLLSLNIFLKQTISNILLLLTRTPLATLQVQCAIIAYRFLLTSLSGNAALAYLRAALFPT